MNIKVGDKVRPLDEKGEGIVVSIVSPDKIVVRDENGFDLPFRKKDLVKIEQEHLFTSVLDKKKEEESSFTEEEEQWDGDVSESPEESKAEELEEGIYLAYELLHPEHFSNTSLGLYFVNNSPFEVHYNVLMNASGLQRSIAFDRIAPQGKVLISKLSKTALEAFCTLTVQAIFTKDAPFPLQEAVSTICRTKPAKLYKESSFVVNDFTTHKAFFVPVHITATTAKKVKLTKDIALNIEKAIKSKEKKGKNTVSKKHFQHTSLSEREVDLHIEELVDDLRGMSNGEIVQIQLNHFQKELDVAIAAHLHKIVFIHGVGTGKLRSEIHEVLKTYSNIRFHDASYSKYGFGATEVIIR